MKIHKLLGKIDALFPLSNAWINDRVGLQVQSDSQEVDNALVAYELNDDVIGEAIAQNCNIIIGFHPLIYSPLTTISNNERVSRLVKRLIKADLAYYSVHTSFDTYHKGSNYILAKKLGLKIEKPLAIHHTDKQIGIGAICSIAQSINSQQLIEKVNQTLNTNSKHNGVVIDSISKIAIVAGSGMSFYNNVINAQAQAFITGDMSYHDFHRADGKILMIDAGHYQTEQWIAENMFNVFKSKIQKGINWNLSLINTNPVEL